jgi:chromosomal replication initiator protein
MESMNYWVIPQMKKKEMNPNKIINEVCEHFNIELAELMSPNRSRRLADPRGVVAYVLREKGLGFKHIGILINRNHSNIIYHHTKVKGFIEVDKSYKELVAKFI